MKIRVGDPAPSLEAGTDGSSHLRTVRGRTATEADAPLATGRHVLLVFLRYASCPMCLLHVRDLGRRHEELSRAGIDVIAVFHSPPARIAHHTSSLALPFRVIADPTFALYARYGVGTSWRGLLSSVIRPGFYIAFGRALLAGFLGGAIDGDVARMPADFLIDPDGIVRAVHRGRAIGDHLAVDEVLRMAARAGPGVAGVVRP